MGFKVNRTYVYEETGEDYAGSIEYVGSTLDSATGGLTGTDQLGAVWFGKLRIGNDGFLKSGEITLVREVMMVAPFGLIWIEMEICREMDRMGMMIVNNLGSHGSRNRVGTVFLGYKAPFAMRPGSITNPGLFAGTKGLSTAYHATKDGGEFSGGE